MATHSGTLAWEIPWTEEPGRLQSLGSQKSQTWHSDSTTKQQQRIDTDETGVPSIYLYLATPLSIHIWPLHAACRILVPPRGIPHLMQRRCGVFTTGHLGSPRGSIFKSGHREGPQDRWSLCRELTAVRGWATQISVRRSRVNFKYKGPKTGFLSCVILSQPCWGIILKLIKPTNFTCTCWWVLKNVCIQSSPRILRGLIPAPPQPHTPTFPFSDSQVP